MAQKVSKSGWKFQPKKLSSLILYTSDSFDAGDLQNLCDLTEQLQNLESEDISSFLKVVPPVEQLIQQIPYTLPLLEALYLKCEIAFVEGKCDFPKSLLNCEQLFCQLLWWTAYCEQKNFNATLNRRIPTLQDLERPVTSILQVLSRNCPGLVQRAHADRAQLTACLESLGCHGLVNCSSGLIRMCDAVYLEVLRHSERIKSVAARVKDFSDNKHPNGAIDPSSASHQRQMSLRLSEVFERLKLNECIEGTLEEAINNAHLTSLLRIVRKRVASDRLLIGLFNAFTRSSPDDFGFEQLDPVVAKLILIFNNSYDKLLSMCPAGECDSGCFGDSSTEGRQSSTGTHCESPRRDFSASSGVGSTKDDDSLEKERTKPEQRSRSCHGGRKFKGRRPSHYSSLKELQTSFSPKLSAARSLGNLNSVGQSSPKRSGSWYSVADNGEKDDAVKLRLHVVHLKNELARAQKQIAQLAIQRKNSNLRYGEWVCAKGVCKDFNKTKNLSLWPEPDYPDASSYYNNSSREDILSLLGRFSELYIKARKEILATLDKLPEFRGSEELQMKTILSCAVLTYRSVVDSVQRKREKIWDIMQEGEGREENEDAEALDLALYRHMYRRAKSQHGMENAKEVTSQIWRTLYDFPSLKTCTIFNRFILECCDVAWDIVAGIEGRTPRMRLDYEAIRFDESRHSRANDSDSGTDVYQVLWPGLVDSATEKCLLKAIVLTN